MWVDLEIIKLSEVRQRRNILWDPLCEESKKRGCKWIYVQNTRDPQNEFMVAGRKDVGEGTVKEFGMDMNTLLYLKRIPNKDLLYSTWNSAQYYAAVLPDGSLGENG